MNRDWQEIVDWREIFLGLRGAGIELAGMLSALVWNMKPWVAVLVCLFCGAWIIVMFVGLMRFVDGGWLRRFRRYHKCAFTGCPARIRTKYRLCRNHFQAASRYEWEHRDEWAAKDATCDAFYVYILELEGGELYAGQTRNLMRRLDQHRNGKTKTTAGREPNLVWFEQLPSRQAAVEKEADLKHLIDTRPAGVQLMVEEISETLMDLLGTSAASAGNERPDVLLGVSWPTWGRWAGSTWLVLFAASWVGMLRAWAGDMVTSLWLPGIVLGCVIGANGVPGAAALCNAALRRRLLSLPEAAALASLTLSAAVGIGGFTTASLLMGENMGVVGAGIVIGTVAFPLSFGLVFPLGIPLGCSFVVWSLIHAGGGISQTAYVLLTSVAAVGWAGVVLIGAVLGVGA